MPKEFSFSPRLQLILNHLRAVREVHRYIHDGELEKDIKDLANELRKALKPHLPAAWEDLGSEGYLWFQPIDKWKVPPDDNLAVAIYLARPVGEDWNPYVNFWVPEEWEMRTQFVDNLKPPHGFQHISQDPDNELAEELTVFKFVPYQDYVKANGVFDGDGFMKEIEGAAESLLRLEKHIDGILERLG